MKSASEVVASNHMQTHYPLPRTESQLLTVKHVPAGVQVSPQGLQIAPNLIVIGPYDTQVSPQVILCNLYHARTLQGSGSACGVADVREQYCAIPVLPPK